MLQEFYINYLNETIESDDLYSIMNKRMSHCKSLDMSPDKFGPPDICYLVKEIQSKTFLGIKTKKIGKSGSYHYVYGLDTSNVAYISAYISKFIQKLKKHNTSTTNNINSFNQSIKISQSIFCVFDYFLEKDLRILIKFPGGVRKIFFIDDAQAIESNPNLIKTVFLSSILRSWNFNTYPVPNNCLFLEEINSSNTFDYLFESIKFLINEYTNNANNNTNNNGKVNNMNNINLNNNLQNNMHNSSINSSPNVDKDNNIACMNNIVNNNNILISLIINSSNFFKKLEILLENFIKYLMNTRRFNFAILNFSKLSIIEPKFTKYVIKPLKFLLLYEDALSYLANILLTSFDTSLLSLEIDILIYLQKYEDAMILSKFCTSTFPENADNWLNLARLYLKLKKYDNCLKALNNIYYLKEFTYNDLNKIKYNEGLMISEIPVQKNKIINNNIGINNNSVNNNEFYFSCFNNINLKINDILIKPKKCIDVYYSTSQFYLCENSDFLQDSTMKIINCPYYSFDKIQIQIYDLLLELIKEINYDSFIDMKRKIFCENINKNLNINSNENIMKNSTQQMDMNECIYIQSESIQSQSNLKITMNPYFEIVVDNLIEDLKMFSLVIAEDDNYFNTFKIKDELSLPEIKFCIAFSILAERLKYFNTAKSFYSKSLQFCFSKFVYIRKIKINLLEGKFKNVIVLLGQLLSCVNNEQFKYINKTPIWIDKIILKVLYEHQATEIIMWVKDFGKNVVDYIKTIINKYKYWIEVGHEIHLIK